MTVRIKIYSARKHLSNLFEIESKHNTFLKGRLKAEIELDCFLSQLLGAKDALRFLINKKFKLGLDNSQVRLGTINSKLSKLGKKDILRELNQVYGDRNSFLASK